MSPDASKKCIQSNGKNEKQSLKILTEVEGTHSALEAVCDHSTSTSLSSLLSTQLAALFLLFTRKIDFRLPIIAPCKQKKQMKSNSEIKKKLKKAH